MISIFACGLQLHRKHSPIFLFIGFSFVSHKTFFFPGGVLSKQSFFFPNNRIRRARIWYQGWFRKKVSIFACVISQKLKTKQQKNSAHLDTIKKQTKKVLRLVMQAPPQLAVYLYKLSTVVVGDWYICALLFIEYIFYLMQSLETPTAVCTGKQLRWQLIKIKISHV